MELIVMKLLLNVIGLVPAMGAICALRAASEEIGHDWYGDSDIGLAWLIIGAIFGAFAFGLIVVPWL